MARPQISVLVPIYNSAKTLGRALDSLIAQAIDTSLEIICINDGSTDRSAKILERYAKKFDHLRIITKNNTGYGDSMNLGIKKARGEYIAILEPDDWIENGTYSTMLKLAEKYRADIVKANYFRDKNKISKLISEIKEDETNQVLRPLDRFTKKQTKMVDFFRFSPAVWSAIYRRDFLIDNELQFLPTPGASYQDLGFTFKTWCLAERVVLTNYPFLHYQVDNENSSINNPGKVFCVVDEYRSIEEFLKHHSLEKTMRSVLEAARFRNYYWNLQRLSDERAREFYPEMVASLKKANQYKWLKRRDFSLKHWLSAQAILKRPESAYRVLRLRERVKIFFSKIK